MLAGTVSIILIAVSIIGYTTASTNLQKSIEQEITATVETQEKSLDGWIKSKTISAINAANQMKNFLGADKNVIQNLMKIAENDTEIMAITNCDETGMVLSNTADYTGKLEIRTRDWYKKVKSEGKLIFTDVYQDATNGKLVVSAAVPYFDANKNFYGAICDDISADTLNEEIKKINYRGEGKGMIIDSAGKIIASSNVEENLQDISASDNFQKMLGKDNGFFITSDENIFAYATVETTGWIVAIKVPQEKVFAPINELRTTYIFLTIATILGLLITVIFSLHFSGRIIRNISAIKKMIARMAKGDLSVEELKVDSSDEFGDLAKSFNSMLHDVRKLIDKVSKTAKRVARSSDELTATAEQSAQAANQVAETTVKVAEEVGNQIKNIEFAKDEVNSVYAYVNSVTEKSKSVSENTNLTATAAKHGETLMQEAMQKMSGIEKSVTDSAILVDKLGQNSKEIEKIIDAISGIADQTNLLALNAAIEAARAGESGRGFSIVADEVRKLSTDSQESVERIRTSIGTIRNDIQKAVLSMNEGTAEVKTGASAIKNVVEQFAKIIEMVNNNKDKIDDITKSVQDVSTGASRIVEIVDQIDYISHSTANHTNTISASTQQQSASTEEIAASSRSLADIATELQLETSRFKVR